MNKLINWSDSLALGVPETDAHHETLVGLLNQLHETVHRRRGVDACRKSVEKLRRYAEMHLAVEEQVIHAAGRVAYRENGAEHQQLVARLDAMLERMDDVDSNITFYGLHQLRTWILWHMRQTESQDAEQPATYAGSPLRNIANVAAAGVAAGVASGCALMVAAPQPGTLDQEAVCCRAVGSRSAR